MKRRMYFLGLLALNLFFINAGSALATTYPTRPSGQIVSSITDGKIYSVYYTPGTNYTDKRLKYIGSGDVYNYYLSRGRWGSAALSDDEIATYTIHNHNLGLPCGEAIRDSQGRIAFMEPLGWPVGQQDQNDPIFSTSENFPYYIQYVNWLSSNGGLHHQNILVQSGYNQVGNYSNIAEMLIYPSGIPNCAIVKQTGTDDYYRVTRHRTPFGVEVERKSKIQNSEMLNLWLNYNSYTYEADITSLPNVGDAMLPPALLFRRVDDPTLYFVDDEGSYVRIPSTEVYQQLGLNFYPVTYLQSNIIDSSKIKVVSF